MAIIPQRLKTCGSLELKEQDPISSCGYTRSSLSDPSSLSFSCHPSKRCLKSPRHSVRFACLYASASVSPEHFVPHYHTSPLLPPHTFLWSRECCSSSMIQLSYYCHRESTRDDHLDTAYSQLKAFIPASWDYTQVFREPSVAPGDF